MRSVTLAEGASEVINLAFSGGASGGGSLAPALTAFGVGVAGLGVGAVTRALVVGWNRIK